MCGQVTELTVHNKESFLKSVKHTGHLCGTSLARIAVRSLLKKILSSGCCSLWPFNWNRAFSAIESGQ